MADDTGARRCSVIEEFEVRPCACAAPTAVLRGAVRVAADACILVGLSSPPRTARSKSGEPRRPGKRVPCRAAAIHWGRRARARCRCRIIRTCAACPCCFRLLAEAGSHGNMPMIGALLLAGEYHSRVRVAAGLAAHGDRRVRNDVQMREGEATWPLRRTREFCFTRGSAGRRTSTPRASTGCAATASTTTLTTRVITAIRSGSTGHFSRA
jgi:hypothetical protein